jgi:hypothetical protein
MSSPVLLGTTARRGSDTGMAVSTASIWQKNGRMSEKLWCRQSWTRTE